MEVAPVKMITLKSSDKQFFLTATTITGHILAEVIDRCYNEDPKVVISEAKFITPMSMDEITITGSILAKVIEYCNKHAEVATSDEDKKIWDAQFMNLDFGTNAQMFSDMMQVVKFLNIQGLVELITQKSATWMTGKTIEEIGQAFDLTDKETQLTPEEEEEISRRLEFISRRRNVGAFE